MYESYTRQALPKKEYRALLGSAICVFNSNFNFLIENILRTDPQKFEWGYLINLVGGNLLQCLKDSAIAEADEIVDLFDTLRMKRNRIVHSFQITNQEGLQSLATRDRDGNQFEITEEYLMDFIEENERLCTLLHAYRGY